LTANDTSSPRKEWLLKKCGLTPLGDDLPEVPLTPVPSYLSHNLGEFVLDVEQSVGISNCITVGKPTTKPSKSLVAGSSRSRMTTTIFPLASPGKFTFDDVELPAYFNADMFRTAQVSKMMVSSFAFRLVSQLTTLLLGRVLHVSEFQTNDANAHYTDIKVMFNKKTCWKRNGNVITSQAGQDDMLGTGRKYTCQMLPLYLSKPNHLYQPVSRMVFVMIEIHLTD
jgi:hypothetical protein